MKHRSEILDCLSDYQDYAQDSLDRMIGYDKEYYEDGDRVAQQVKIDRIVALIEALTNE